MAKNNEDSEVEDPKRASGEQKAGEQGPATTPTDPVKTDPTK